MFIATQGSDREVKFVVGVLNCATDCERDLLLGQANLPCAIKYALNRLL